MHTSASDIADYSGLMQDGLHAPSRASDDNSTQQSAASLNPRPSRSPRPLHHIQSVPSSAMRLSHSPRSSPRNPREALNWGIRPSGWGERQDDHDQNDQLLKARGERELHILQAKEQKEEERKE